MMEGSCVSIGNVAKTSFSHFEYAEAPSWVIISRKDVRLGGAWVGYG